MRFLRKKSAEWRNIMRQRKKFGRGAEYNASSDEEKFGRVAEYNASEEKIGQWAEYIAIVAKKFGRVAEYFASEEKIRPRGGI